MQTILALGLIALTLSWLLRRYLSIRQYWEELILQWDQNIAQLKQLHHRLNTLLLTWEHSDPSTEDSLILEDFELIEQHLAHLILEGDSTMWQAHSMRKLQHCEEQLYEQLKLHHSRIEQLSEHQHNSQLASQLHRLEIAFYEHCELAALYNECVDAYNAQQAGVLSSYTASLFAFPRALPIRSKGHLLTGENSPIIAADCAPQSAQF